MNGDGNYVRTQSSQLNDDQKNDVAKHLQRLRSEELQDYTQDFAYRLQQLKTDELKTVKQEILEQQKLMEKVNLASTPNRSNNLDDHPEGGETENETKSSRKVRENRYYLRSSYSNPIKQKKNPAKQEITDFSLLQRIRANLKEKKSSNPLTTDPVRPRTPDGTQTPPELEGDFDSVGRTPMTEVSTPPSSNKRIVGDDDTDDGTSGDVSPSNILPEDGNVEAESIASLSQSSFERIKERALNNWKVDIFMSFEPTKKKNSNESNSIIENWCFNIVFTLNVSSKRYNEVENSGKVRESFEEKLGETGRDLVTGILEGAEEFDVAYEIRSSSTRAMNQNVFELFTKKEPLKVLVQTNLRIVRSRDCDAQNLRRFLMGRIRSASASCSLPLLSFLSPDLTKK